MAFRKLGVEFVHKGLSSFTKAMDRVNRSFKEWGRSQIEQQRSILYTTRAAEQQARVLKNQLERSYEGAIRATIRYSDQMARLKLQMGYVTRQQMEQYLQSAKYKTHVDQLIRAERERGKLLRQISTLQGSDSAKRDKLISQINQQENEMRRLTSIMKSEITLMGQSKDEQDALWEVAGKIVEISKEKRASITDLISVYGGYNNALEDHKVKLKDLINAQANWGNTTKQFMNIAKGFTIVRAATGDVIAIFQILGNVLKTLTGIFGKVISVIGNTAIAIGRTLFGALKKLLSIPINMIKGMFNSLTGSLQRVFEIIIGMNASRLLWGLGRKLIDLGKTAYQAGEDFQFLTIRLEGLMRRELKKAGYDAAEAMALAGGEVEDLTMWVSRLAVLSPISADTVARTLTLAMSYNFTAKEAKILTEASVKFATAMGLENTAMEKIIENFGQMRQQGKITGTELRDLARGAFVPVSDILERMGVNVGLISGVELPSLENIVTTIDELLRAGDLTKSEANNIVEGLKEVAVGTSISAQGLKELTTRGVITQKMLSSLGISVEDLDEAMSDEHFENLKDELDELVASGEVSLDEFFAAFIDIVNEDFDDALQNASTSMKVARDNARDFLETMIGWRVVTPVLDVISDKVAKALQSLMSDESAEFFESMGEALASITERLFDFVDALLDISAYKNTIGNITRVLQTMFVSVKEIMQGGLSSDARQNTINAMRSLGLSTPGLIDFANGLIDLNTAFNEMDDATFVEKLGAIKDAILTMLKPIWEEIVKPELEKLYDNIKTFVVDQWNNEIKPALADFATETLLPGLETFITETLPSWSQTVIDNVGPMATAFSETLWTSLDKLSTWAGENQPGGALDLAIGLLKSLSEFVGISKKPEDPFAEWMPDYGPHESKFESSGLAQALNDISEAIKDIIANSEELQTGFIEPLQSFLESDFADAIDSIVELFVTIANIQTAPFRIMAKFFEILGNILGADLLAGGSIGGEGKRGGMFWRVVEWIADLGVVINDMISLPVDMAIEALDWIGEVVDIFQEVGTLKGVEFPEIDFLPIENLANDVLNLFGGGEKTGPLTSLGEWISGFSDDTETIVSDMKNLETEIGAIGNEGSFDLVPFGDMLRDTEDGFQTLYDNLIGNSIIPEMVTAIIDYFDENLPTIAQEFTDLVTDIEDELDAVDLKPYGQDMMQGLLDGMQVKFAEILSWWQFTALPQLTAIMNLLFHFGSPSRVFTEYGKLMMEGLRRGIESEYKKTMFSLENRMKNLNNVAGHVNNVNNSNVTNNNMTSLDNRNIIINMQQSSRSFSLDYDYVRAIV